MVSFERGIKEKDLRELGRASTISALANQRILHKEGVEELQEISEILGAAGINVAHTGTVVGIIYTEGEFDLEKFKSIIKKEPYMKNCSSIKDYKIVAGGAKLQNIGGKA
jgi:L-threonine kinase